MKKLFLAVLILLITMSAIVFADTKVSQMSELDATPESTDMLYIIDDPGGTPISKKITVGNLLGSLTIGTDVQAWDADLDTWAGVTPSGNGTLLVSAADYAAMRALLDLEVGTDVLAPDGDGSSLTSITLGDNPDLSGTERVNIPGGTTGTRPSGTYGDVRYNSTLGILEWYSTDWNSILDDSDLGVSVQAYDADTAKTDTNNTWSGTQAFQNPAFSLGADDTIDGILTIYGDGSNTGGSLWLYNGASEDGVVEYWSIASYADSFAIRSESSPVAYFTSSGGLELTSVTASGAVSAGSLTVESNTVDFGDVTEDYVLTFNASTNTWSGEAASGGTTLPADPGADRYLMWDDSETGSELTWATVAGTGDALVANPLSQFASTTSAELAGVLSDETGSGGGFVRATSPTLVTPALGTIASGVGTALTALNGENIQDDTIDDDSIDFSDVTLADFGLAATHDTAAELDALYEAELDNSAGLAAALSDETGTGVAVFATSPTLTTPALGTPSAIVLTNASGTASININGTVGATTPAAGTFTTVTANSFATGPSTTPQLELEDATDDADGEIKIIASSVSTDTYDSVLLMQVDEAGVATTYLELDGANTSVDFLKNTTLQAGDIITADLANDAVTADKLDDDGNFTLTGTLDFGGASLEIPNGTDPDVDAAGEISFDTDDNTIRGYDGSAQVVLGMKNHTIHCTVISPNDLDDATRDKFFVWSNESGFSFIVTKIEVWSDTDDTALVFDEFDADGASNTAEIDGDLNATTGSGPYTDTETDITNPTIEADHTVFIDFDDTDDPGWVKVSITGYFNADVD